MMRMSDGFIWATDYGVILRINNEKFAENTMIDWPLIMLLNHDQRKLTEVITGRIEAMESRLKFYCRGGAF